jgi:hypothetical protein
MLAVEAVIGELVSAQIPGNREKYREICFSEQV